MTSIEKEKAREERKKASEAKRNQQMNASRALENEISNPCLKVIVFNNTHSNNEI